MPELPEAETIRRQLKARIKGKTVLGAQVFYPKVLRGIGAKDFEHKLRGRKIKDVGRHGKLLLIRFDDKKEETLIVHLKLTGRLIFGAQKNKSTEVLFKFKDGTALRYDDIRRFGYMKLAPRTEETKILEKEHLGMDFFDKKLTPGEFKRLLASRGGARIKPLLMDQSVVAGIGNIYAQEACFLAGAHPEKKAAELSRKELAGLYRGLRKIMRSAIRHRGSSVDSYRDAFGREGGFVRYLKVYGREGKPCVRCKSKLLKKTVGGRGTVWCPKCQK